LLKMLEIQTYLNRDRVQECWNDLKYYREEIRALFRRNQVSLAMTARTERAYLYLMNKIKTVLLDPEAMTEDMHEALVQAADIYHCNFSLFQSLPDVWAIDQLHPLAPIQRLHEAPVRAAILSDITCDSDGKIDKFVLGDGISDTLPVHDLIEGEDYYLGVFFVGAYQETLGDLHNLFGDTNVVTVALSEDGGFDILKEQDGDTIYEVLSYVEYEPKQLIAAFKANVEKAVKGGRLSPSDRRQMLRSYTDSMNGYTYFEHAEH
jgi:arginine decarboxylase